MAIHHTTVRQWCFTCAKVSDPIRVILDDISEKEGRITITCHNQAWVTHWHNLQETSLERVLVETPISDLAKMFFQGQRWAADLTSLSQRAMTEGEKLLDSEDLGAAEKIDIEDALEKLESLESAGYEDVFSFSSELSLILGNDWWDTTPTIMTPGFAHLNDILLGVQQEALSDLGER